MVEESFPPVPPQIPPGWEGASTEDAERPRIPWEERNRLGWADALIETVKLIVTAPADAFSRLRADGEVIWPLLFGLFFSWLGQAFGQMWNLVFGQAMQSNLGEISELEGFGQLFAASPLSALIWIVVWPLLFGIVMLISAGIFHLSLLLVGATNKSATGFEGTFKVLCYAQVSSLLSIVPILGGLLAILASLVLTVIGFTKVHQANQGSALVAVLIPVSLCCVCCLVFFVLMIGGAMAALTAGG